MLNVQHYREVIEFEKLAKRNGFTIMPLPQSGNMALQKEKKVLKSTLLLLKRVLRFFVGYETAQEAIERMSK